MSKTNIRVRHCQCREKCADEKSRRVCPPGCSHRDRYQVRRRMPPDGKRKSKMFASYAAAERYLAELEGEWLDRKVATIHRQPKTLMTFGEVADDWYGIKALAWEPRTAEENRRIIDQLWKPLMGDRRIADISKDDLQRLIQQWDREGYARSTIRNRIVNIALPVLEYAEKPVRGLTFPAESRRSGRITDEEVVAQGLYLADMSELRTLLNAMPERYRLMVEFMALVGTRWGETVPLTQGDIVNGMRMSIHRAAKRATKAEDPSGYRIGKPKTHRARMVAVPPKLLDKLRDADAPRDALLFAEDDGSLVDRNRFSKAFREARKALPDRLARLRIHDLRHSAASMLANGGAPMKLVADQLGHADIAITARVYTHVFPGTVDALMLQMNQAVTALGQ